MTSLNWTGEKAWKSDGLRLEATENHTIVSGLEYFFFWSSFQFFLVVYSLSRRCTCYLPAIARCPPNRLNATRQEIRLALPHKPPSFLVGLSQPTGTITIFLGPWPLMISFLSAVINADALSGNHGGSRTAGWRQPLASNALSQLRAYAVGE